MNALRWLWIVASLLACPFSGAEEVEKDSPPVIATVGDTAINEDARGDLGAVVLGALLENYAAERNITVSDEEITKLLASMAEGEKRERERDGKRMLKLASELESDQHGKEEREEKTREFAALKELADDPVDELTDAENKEVAELRGGMARSIIQSWKVNKALFKRYGGRVVYQQMGPEPIDAYRKFLEAQQKAGAFQLNDKKYEPDLWRIFTRDDLHDFVPEDQRSILIQTPPWERKESGE